MPTALLSCVAGEVHWILVVEMNLPLTILSPNLQNGNWPYIGFSLNQAPEMSTTVPPDVKPLFGSSFVTIGLR